MSASTKAWSYFLNARLMHVSLHSDIMPNRAILLYAIIKELSIDVGRVIQCSILHAIRKVRNGMAYPSLIIELCSPAGVLGCAVMSSSFLNISSTARPW
ncbi:hypothetical protein TorRG33x02_155990 [Trema orientale]|uniref:Putative plant transposon protein domain-containing protein n=1 Tax=Trema orientale TaxID=63057 RepID=A0A2P5ESL4_TREOI|nr:hypothetical protein TorRG33x02_155990 [Trema orientale]